MKRLLALAAFVGGALIAGRVTAQVAPIQSSGTITASGQNVAANGLGQGQSTCEFSLSVSGSMTFVFESLGANGTTWTGINAFPLNNGAAVSSTSTSLEATVPVAGLNGFRVRVNTFVSGTATIYIYCTAGTEWGIPSNVNVQNTPGVNIQNTPGVTVQNTPGVNVQNTPGVFVFNTPGVNVQNTPGVTVQNTPSVTVFNTPGVTVQNTPAVKVVAQPTDSGITGQTLATSGFGACGSAGTSFGGAVNGQPTVGYEFTGLTASSAVFTFEATLDAVPTWFPAPAYNASGVTSTTATADGIYRIPSAGYAQVRARCSTAGTGTVTISYLDTIAALALSGGSGSSVTVANTPGVTVQNTPGVTVQNTPGVTVQNTPSVTVFNTPGVTVQNTPGVNVQNTPSVTVFNTPGVTVQNTPGVNVLALPTDNALTGNALALTSTLNTVVVTLGRQGATVFQLVSLTGSGATVEFDGETDAVPTWKPVLAFLKDTNVGATTTTVDGLYAINTTGLLKVRVRVVVAGTGSATVSYDASDQGSTINGGISVLNTPGVNVQNTPGVTVQNTPGVNVQNTPGVTVQNTPGVFVFNTPGVTVQNTPGVNIQNATLPPGPIWHATPPASATEPPMTAGHATNIKLGSGTATGCTSQSTTARRLVAFFNVTGLAINSKVSGYDEGASPTCAQADLVWTYDASLWMMQGPLNIPLANGLATKISVALPDTTDVLLGVNNY